MTFPTGDAPTVALKEGSRYGQDETEDGIRSKIGGPVRKSYQGAQDAFKGMLGNVRVDLDQTASVGSGMSDRIDLLEATSGYASAFMSKSYRLTDEQNYWSVLPFDTQVGPAKGAAVVTSGSGTGWIRVNSGGLWRADLHATTAGFTQTQTIYPTPAPPYFTVMNAAQPIVVQFMIMVVDDQGQLITSRLMETVSNSPKGSFAAPLPESSAAPVSTAFSHTFVLDRIERTGKPVFVRASIAWRGTTGGTVNTAFCSIRGGSLKSSLTVSRWSQDVSHVNYAPSVPDGGTLG